MKKRLTTLALVITGFAGFAQQDPQFTQFMFSKLFTNPGYAGTSSAICANFTGRNQWTGFPGAPQTGVLCVDASVSPKFGVGLSVDYDKLGFDQTIGAKIAGSYIIPVMSGLGKIGIGLELGIQSKTISGNWIAPDGSTTAAGNINDGAIPAAFSSTNYDLGLGVYFTHANGTYFGLSSTHLPDASESLTSKGAKSYKFDVARHYYVTAGTSFPLGSSNFDLRPNLLVKSDAKVTTFDVNLNVLWNKMFWLGVSYRMQDAIAPMLGFQGTTKGGGPTALNWRIGYSYDVTTSEIKLHSSGSHEIVLGVCKKIDHTPKPESWEDVRFF
ncbi:MAG TPA: type IX secretion system membrane protein PorP/SprF [Bacteroidia bacterium]|jgi:type IX secretion system PorP/SprF family membrane protein|nr:type IX secretion system membrane protein PorP/SprF [Bacteroidia bacterium]